MFRNERFRLVMTSALAVDEGDSSPTAPKATRLNATPTATSELEAPDRVEGFT